MTVGHPKRGTFLNSEKSQVLADLDEILDRIDRVRGTLYVAARRRGKVPTAWADGRLDALVDEVRHLRGVAADVPLESD